MLASSRQRRPEQSTNETVDWALNESVRASLRAGGDILRRYSFPLDLQEEAVRTGLAQAELLAKEWAA